MLLARSRWLTAYAALLMLNFALIGINAALNAGYHLPLEVLDAQLDLKREGNLAVWFSSVQLLAAGVAALVIAACCRSPKTSRWAHWIIWGGAAALLIGLSADEVAQLHEWAGERYADYFGDHDPIAAALGLQGSFDWLLVLAPLIVLGAGWLAFISLRILNAHRPSMWLSLLAVGCWLTTLGAEYVEDRLHIAHQENMRRHQATIEEGCELLGAALFLVAFSDFARVQLATRRIAAAPTPAVPHSTLPPNAAANFGETTLPA